MTKQLQVVDKQGQQPATVQGPGMITLAGSIDQMVEQFQLYQQLKTRLADKDDFQKIGKTQFPKKSFVRKIQRAFNLSCEIIQDEPLKDEKGKIIAWLAKARAIHTATGSFQEADGSCSFDEKVDRNGKPIKAQQTIHNIRAHAVTRAKNRAILDLVGFGDVSAEEINASEYGGGGYGYDEQPQRQQRQMNPLNQRKREILTTCRQKGLTDQQAAKVVATLLKRNTNDMTLEEAGNILEVVQTSEGGDLLELIGEGEVETVEVEVVEEEPEEPPITTGQLKAIHAAARDKGITEEERRAVIRHVSKGRTDSSKGLYHREAREVINTINGNKKEAIQRLAGTFTGEEPEAKLNEKRKNEELQEFFTEWMKKGDQLGQFQAQ